MSNWICGVSASENRQNRVSHGESVRVGSSGPSGFHAGYRALVES